MRSFRRRNSTTPDQSDASHEDPGRPEAPREDSYVPPTTISILESHARGENLENEVSSLASDYAREGESLEAFFDDLDVLLEAAGLPEATPAMLRRAGSAWSIGVLERLDAVSCEDPLTGLATVQHLRSVVEGLGRAWSDDAPNGHTVVVVELIERGLADDSEGLARFAQTLRIAIVAEELRAAFTSDEVLARVSDSRCIALVRDAEDLPMKAARVKKAIGRRLQMGPHGFVCKVWTEPVPHDKDALGTWITALGG